MKNHQKLKKLQHARPPTLSEPKLSKACIATEPAAARDRDMEIAHDVRSPKDAETWCKVASALKAQNQIDGATRAYLEAIALEPKNPNAYVSLGLLFEEQGKAQEAFLAYQALLSVRPGDVRASNNIAGVLIGMGHFDLAVAASRAATALAPGLPDVYLNLALALTLRGDHEEALATYKKVVSLDPHHGGALVELCHRRQHACEWDGLEEQQAASRTHSYQKGKLVSPFAIMTSGVSALEQQLCARVWGKRLKGLSGAPLAPYRPRPVHARQDKLRIGYLSSDFHNHATAMLIVEMLEQHDRNRFTIVGYSIGPDDGSLLRHRIVAAFDKFVDLRNHSDAEAARVIRNDQIDILLDLKGYTQNARVKILAYEPAPIQVNYLGFPGTMGVPFIDYIIADEHVVPQGNHSFYDEKVVYLPHCYQPNDRKRPLPSTTVSRRDFGLPEDVFVFCCFNSPYKITPIVFEIWMRLLIATPAAILWLLEPNRQAADNLRREAEVRGVASSRLLFAPFVDAETHLSRFALADLFLDTFPVNAHTTASEALWAGLPLLTCTGDTFASRVAASLLHAVQTPELVTQSPQDYEKAALHLVQNPDQLHLIRDRLTTNRLTAPLFDTPRYTRDFENALLHMATCMDLGHPPASF